MNILKRAVSSIGALFTGATTEYSGHHSRDHHTGVNPATSLPMNGSVDIAGNPYGTSSPTTDHTHHNDHLSNYLAQAHHSTLDNTHYNDSFRHDNFSSTNDFHNSIGTGSFDHNNFHDPFRNY